MLSKLQHCDDSGTQSESTMALARAWLLDCLTNHRQCSVGDSTLPKLPMRVIDVGTRDEEPSLVHTQGRRGKYCALSYCWGRHPFLRTTKATLAEHQKRIPLDDFPRTLKDAILISRKLCIPYIWIDALCIIQDDANDWAHESKAMASIYRNAIVTIIAASANDTTEGCFQTRARNRVWPVRIPTKLSRKQRRLMYSLSQRRWNLSSDFWGACRRPPRDPSASQDDLFVYTDHLQRDRGPIDDRAW
ncbi:HET-domain-containing protein [Ophiobolus disseminans]|uniref:HET-domain-containing protein n=1 Tax=Ophiobolus disseminans TaxID=1469910 RepID=A0A6A7ACC2_9PLEO|nr:HET-domain-containing protein [Ophiobolus disseminans]